MPFFEPLKYDIHVTSPLGHDVLVNKVHRNCPIMIHGKKFDADLLSLNVHEFDIILGMDWLHKYQAMVDCCSKTVVLRSVDGTETVVHGIRSSALTNVISAIQASRLMRKGCEAYLAVILDSKRGQVELEDIPVVREFSDVFPEELPGLPPEREVELSIDVVSGTYWF